MRRTPPPGLRDEVEAAVLAAAEQVGPDGFSKTACVAPFLDRGVARSTLFAWVDHVLVSGKPAARITAIVEEAAAARAERVADPAADAGREIVAAMPKPVRPEDIAAPGQGLVVMISYLQDCIMVARDLMQHARNADGSIRNAKLLMQAGESLRRTMETTLRIHQAMREIQATDAFHLATVDEIAKESPACAERIHRRLLEFIPKYERA